MIEPRKVIIDECSSVTKQLETLEKSFSKIRSMFEYLPADTIPGQDKFKELLARTSHQVTDMHLATLLLGSILMTPEELKAQEDEQKEKPAQERIKKQGV